MTPGQSLTKWRSSLASLKQPPFVPLSDTEVRGAPTNEQGLK